MPTIGSPLESLDTAQLQHEGYRTESRPAPSAAPRGPVYRSLAMERLLQRSRLVGRSDTRVLIQGETGTGKELLARFLHDQGPRRLRPFVPVNCAAFPDTLLEAELFGHERGAFSGAVGRREGRFQKAHRGTLFLDEVAELPLVAQAKLLRVLEEGTFEPLGTSESVYADVRVIAATHRDLTERIARREFREDLYYRLRVIQLDIPPLRARQGDVELLTDHFLRAFAPRSAPPPSVSDRAMQALARHSFPGNVRELKHAIEQAIVLADGREIDLPHLPTEIAGPIDAGPIEANRETIEPLAHALRAFEREHLLRALRQADGRRGDAAKLLGISRKNLWEKLRKHEISSSEGKPVRGESWWRI